MDSLGFSLPKRRESALSLAEIETGIETIQATAVRLLRDARLLLTARRYASAATLAAMALTELGRVAPLLELATAKSEHRIKTVWRQFRDADHPLPWALFEPAIGPSAEGEINNLVRMLRMAGSRSECIEPGVWVSGDQLVHRALAAELIATAELVCCQKLDRRAIEIWIDTVGTLPRNASASRTLEAYRDALTLAGLPGDRLVPTDIFEGLVADAG